MPRLCCHLVALEAKRRSVRSKTASRGVLFSPLLMCACAVIGRGWQALTGQGVESLCKTPSLPTSTVEYADPPLSGVCVSLTRRDREKAMLRRLRVFSLVRPQLGVNQVGVDLGRWHSESPSQFYSELAEGLRL